MAQLNHAADQNGSEDDNAVLIAGMSLDLQARVEDIRQQVDNAPSASLSAYDAAKPIFEEELPGHDFDEFLGPSVVSNIERTRTAMLRCEPKWKRLQEADGWKLDRATFIQHFGEDMLESYRFLGSLVQLAEVVTLDTALPALNRMQQLRTSGTNPRPGVSRKERWQPDDVSMALKEFAPQQGVTASRTPRKRKRIGANNGDESVSFQPFRFREVSLSGVTSYQSQTPTVRIVSMGFVSYAYCFALFPSALVPYVALIAMSFA